MDNVRVDRWLWSVRLYKTRTLATKSCREGKVKLGSKKIKSAHLIKLGDVLSIIQSGVLLSVRVDRLILKRVSADIAKECYTDLTPSEEKKRHGEALARMHQVEWREKGLGRPTKRDRRRIGAFKERGGYQQNQ